MSKAVICGIPFTIMDVREDFDPFGKTDARAATIKVFSGCSPEQREATLVHEWCHAVLMCNGVSHEEAQVAVLSTELYRQGFRIEIIEDEPSKSKEKR